MEKQKLTAVINGHIARLTPASPVPRPQEEDAVLVPILLTERAPKQSQSLQVP